MDDAQTIQELTRRLATYRGVARHTASNGIRLAMTRLIIKCEQKLLELGCHTTDLGALPRA